MRLKDEASNKNIRCLLKPFKLNSLLSVPNLSL